MVAQPFLREGLFQRVVDIHWPDAKPPEYIALKFSVRLYAPFTWLYIACSPVVEPPSGGALYINGYISESKWSYRPDLGTTFYAYGSTGPGQPWSWTGQVEISGLPDISAVPDPEYWRIATITKMTVDVAGGNTGFIVPESGFNVRYFNAGSASVALEGFPLDYGPICANFSNDHILRKYQPNLDAREVFSQFSVSGVSASAFGSTFTQIGAYGEVFGYAPGGVNGPGTVWLFDGDTNVNDPPPVVGTIHLLLQKTS